MKYIRVKDGGYFLVMVLVFGTIAVLALSGLISFANTNLLSGRRAIQSEQAFRIAESGIEYYRWHLAHAPTDYTDGGGAFPHVHNFYDKNGNLLGTFSLTITAPAASSTLSVVSKGVPASNASVRRTVSVNYVAGDGIIFHYGVQSGVGGFTLGNNSEIDGNVYSNGSITGGNGSSISGGAFAVGSITNVQAGQKETGVDPIAFPITDAEISSWKSDAAASVFVGNKTVSGNSSLGPIKIQGDLIISGALTINNTVWVTGDIVLGNDSSISLAPSFGSTGGIIIADGEISLGNNVTLRGSGDLSSDLLLISLSNSSGAINLGNGNTASLILYAPNGRINIGNNATVAAVAGKSVTLGNNADLQYKTGVINPYFTSGPSGGWQLIGWKEIK
jgi:hypothetical protein